MSTLSASYTFREVSGVPEYDQGQSAQIPDRSW